MFGSPSAQADMPRNWLQAHDFFEGRRYKDRDYRRLTVGNTEVRLCGSMTVDGRDEPVYAVQLYSTDIITFYPDGSMDLDAYESNLTNSRRDDAGVPTIRPANSMNVPKRDRLEYQTRWAKNFSGGRKFPYGLPAVDLKLDPHGHVTHLDGVPVDEFREHMRVPIKDAQKERRRVLRRTRELLLPWAQGMEALGPGYLCEFKFDETDAELLLRDIDRDGKDPEEAVAEFIDGHVVDANTERRRYFSSLQLPTYALKAQISSLMPGENKDDGRLWEWEPVKPEELDQWLG